MCESVGREGLDCLRVRIGGVDTRQLAGRADLARAELDALRPLVESQPPLQTTTTGFGRSVDLRLRPDETTLAAVLETIPTIAAAGALPRRNAVRSLLMLAEAGLGLEQLPVADEMGGHTVAEAVQRRTLDSGGDAEATELV